MTVLAAPLQFSGRPKAFATLSALPIGDAPIRREGEGDADRSERVDTSKEDTMRISMDTEHALLAVGGGGNHDRRPGKPAEAT